MAGRKEWWKGGRKEGRKKRCKQERIKEQEKGKKKKRKERRRKNRRIEEREGPQITAVLKFMMSVWMQLKRLSPHRFFLYSFLPWNHNDIVILLQNPNPEPGNNQSIFRFQNVHCHSFRCKHYCCMNIGRWEHVVSACTATNSLILLSCWCQISNLAKPYLLFLLFFNTKKAE